MAAPSDAGRFGNQLANALMLVEQLPNPLFLVYNYVLNIAGGVNPLSSSWPVHPATFFEAHYAVPFPHHAGQSQEDTSGHADNLGVTDDASSENLSRHKVQVLTLPDLARGFLCRITSCDSHTTSMSWLIPVAGVEQGRSSRLSACLSALEDAARACRAAQRRPAVLVIDNAERLAAKEAVMRDVLFAAQQWADQGLVRVVFVSSDDTLITHLLGG